MSTDCLLERYFISWTTNWAWDLIIHHTCIFLETVSKCYCELFLACWPYFGTLSHTHTNTLTHVTWVLSHFSWPMCEVTVESPYTPSNQTHSAPSSSALPPVKRVDLWCLPASAKPSGRVFTSLCQTRTLVPYPAVPFDYTWLSMSVSDNCGANSAWWQ